MNEPLQNLNDCGCGTGLSDQTPQPIANRPGLPALDRRVGSYVQFKQTMLARLSTNHQPILQALKTRDRDDFTIALLDAWATVADVLTFYQARIANEAYLRTATERRSLLELARLIGYELRPGVAAAAELAFVLETAIGAPRSIVIPAGTKVQSVPNPGEQAQTFETMAAIAARPAWNAIQPRLSDRHLLTSTTNRLRLAGTPTGIKPGDGILFQPAIGALVFGSIQTVTPHSDLLNASQSYTEITLQRLGAPIASAFPAVSSTAAQLGAVPPALRNTTIAAADLEAIAQADRFSVQTLFDNLAANAPAAPGVLVFRARASMFGHNAPRFDALPYSLRGTEVVYAPKQPNSQEIIVAELRNGIYRNRTWVDDLTLLSYPNTTTQQIDLDNFYPNVVQGGYLVLRDGDRWASYAVSDNREVSIADFTLSAKVSRVTLVAATKLDQFKLRSTIAYVQSEWLPLARQPIDLPIPAATNQAALPLRLNNWVEGLTSGQRIRICGERLDSPGVEVCESARIDRVEHRLEPDGCTQITFTAALRHRYVRQTVEINANVAIATHGETREEVLGSGDASLAFQQFVLRQPPLTQVRSTAANGIDSTLQIYVNDVQWQAVDSFYGRSPIDRIYTTRTEEDGRTIVQFGDGRTGARLPTGQDNIRAVYRQGIGLAGCVQADQLRLLLSRPPGVQSVSNALAATGGADPETLAEARQNAPLTILTLDRIVSLQDYEDFARAFAGIAKAIAVWTNAGSQRGVFVTVAGAAGVPVAESDRASLIAAMQQAGDAYIPLRVESYRPHFFRLGASLKLDPTYSRDRVLSAAEQALRYHFAFEQRSFGQAARQSEAIALLQNLTGVVAVQINQFYKSGMAATKQSILTAQLPQPGSTSQTVQPAELLTLDAIRLEEMA